MLPRPPRRALLAGSAAALLATGCGDLGDPVQVTLPTTCAIAPASLDFGEVPAGSSADSTVILTNRADERLELSLALGCGGFSLPDGGLVSLAPGESDTLRIRFSPATTGPHSCRWEPGLGCPPVQLSGNAGSAPPPSFAADIQPLLTASCTGSSCHDSSSPAAGLDLTEGSAHGELVGVVSTFYAPALRVVAGNAGDSVLWNKVANTGRFGGKMPPGGRFPASSTQLIEDWINAGAPAN